MRVSARFARWAASSIGVLAACVVLGAAEEPASIAGRWAEHFDAGDMAAIAALWTEDGVLVRPKTTYSGRREIEAQYRELLELASGKTLRMEQAAEETWVDGDRANGWGTFTITVDDETLEHGQYVFRAVREDGRWRWSRLWTQATRLGIEVEIDPATLDDYVGVYRQPDIAFTLEITREDDRLFGAPPGLDRALLSPEGKDRFFQRDLELRLLFERDETGKVVRITADGMPGALERIK